MTAQSSSATSRAACEAFDRADPIRAFRDRFRLPEGVIYLDGNSLGALPKATAERVKKVLDVEWGEHLVDGWLKDNWMGLSEALGDKIAKLIGADAGEVIVVDTTSINVHKVIAAAMLINIIVAGLAGVLVPLSLERAGADPAVASSVFVTMVTDSMGFLAFLGLATWVGLVR